MMIVTMSAFTVGTCRLGGGPLVLEVEVTFDLNATTIPHKVLVEICDKATDKEVTIESFTQEVTDELAEIRVATGELAPVCITVVGRSRNHPPIRVEVYMEALTDVYKKFASDE